jgi:hypothetical protein
MCADDADQCYICGWLDGVTVRAVDWCPVCFTREVAEGLAVCIRCAADLSV